MKKFLYKVWSKFLTWFGNIKVFPYPFWIVYDPTEYAVKGEQLLTIISLVKPGDIILRGYSEYLDSKFIPDKLKYSHAGIYVGNNLMVHAIAENVSYINILDFCACDRIAIFRPKKGQRSAIKTAKEFAKQNIPYDFGFSRGTSALYCFELAAECYPKLDIPRCTPTKLFGLIKKKDVFLAESFFKSPDLECIFQYNPEFNIV